MQRLDDKINEFKQHYDSNINLNNAALNYFISKIRIIEGVKSVTGRVKDYDECVSKFKRKYLPTIDPKNTDYKIADYITDFIGVRAVCYYLEDVDSIRKQLKKQFSEIDITDKSVLLEQTDNKFGYKSLHLDLELKNKRKKSAKIHKYLKIPFELQIRTIIQDVWSVLDHNIKYKKSIPQGLKRRINRLSALFEIADDEFLRIIKEIRSEEKHINERIKKGGTIDNNKPLDVFRFLFVALKYFQDYNFIEFKVDGFVQEILSLNKKLTENELNEALANHLDVTELIAKNEKRGLNPYTKIRYCLYLFDRNIFSKLLSVYQKEVIHKTEVI